jgi:uncharacterized OsmC-like protein
MKISAIVKNTFGNHSVAVETNQHKQTLSIASKPSGFGSSVNGGELLMLALATCFCNDIYREAGKRNITVSGVEVTVTGEFDAEGEPGTDFQYKAHVISDAPAAAIEELINYTDRVAEIHNTLRKGISVSLIKE